MRVRNIYLLLLLCCLYGGSGHAAYRTMEQIRKSGVIRVVMTREFEIDQLPRRQTPRQYESGLLDNLAKRLKLKIEYVYLDSFEDVFPTLLKGQGDIAADNITITPERIKQVIFSNPVAAVTEHIVGRADHVPISIQQLKGKTVTVTRGTTYVDTMKELIRKVPGIKLRQAVKGMEPEYLLDMVGRGAIPYTVADSNYLESFQSYRSDVKSVYKFPQERYIGWAMPPQAKELRDVVNLFLKLELPVYQQKKFIGDWEQIVRRGYIRVLTRNSPMTYYLHRGQRTGFEFELAKKFADTNKLRLVMVTPPDDEPLELWLRLGRGDLIAADKILPENIDANSKISWCAPYAPVQMVVVAGKGKTISSLDNCTVIARKDSAQWRFLNRLRNHGSKVKLVAAPAGASEFELISEVADGNIECAAIDNLSLLVVKDSFPNVNEVFKLGKERRYAWCVRKDQVVLKNKVDAFFKEYYRSAFYNLTYRKYYSPDKHVDTVMKLNGKNKKATISKFDEIIVKHSNKNYFPWCLIAAQIYQESRFDPNIKAWDGGMGLMQLMPATAKEMGCDKPFDPDDNVRAGVAYLNKLRSRTPSDIDGIDRICFALAGYNGGYGHLLDARRLADQMNLDSKRWRDNVEKTYKLLSRRQYAAKARYGYCRSDIITAYVNDILTRYYHYRQATGASR